jgi:uncharacterized cofD-like protein
VEPASICAEYDDGSMTRGEVEVDDAQRLGRRVRRVWLEPEPAIHPAVAQAIKEFDAVVIGPGSFFTSLMPPLLVRGVSDALAAMPGPVILIGNLLTEAAGMSAFSTAEAARWVAETIRRPVDVVIANTGSPSDEAVARYAAEQKRPLPLGDFEQACEVVVGQFWCRDIARHDRRRLSFAVWSVLSERLLGNRVSTPAALATASANRGIVRG